jgi:hypothetical protein
MLMLLRHPTRQALPVKEPLNGRSLVHKRLYTSGNVEASSSAEFVIGHAAPFGTSSLQARFVPQVALTALPADLLFSGQLHRTSIQDGV